jgi:hypothetical protein
MVFRIRVQTSLMMFLFLVGISGILISCGNPLGNSSSAQPSFLPGSGTGSPVLTDNSFSLFNLGTMTGTTWDNATSVVRLDQAGSATDLELDPTWTPAWSNIVGYWKMNGTVGSIANTAIIPATVGANAVASNANGTGMAYTTGKLNQGINLDGVDDYAIVPHTAALDLTTAWTVSAWVNYSAHTAATAILTAGFTGGSIPFMVGWDSGTNISVGYYSSGWTKAIASSDLPTGSWQFVVGSYSGATNTLSLYINGLLVATNTSVASSIPSNANPKYIGRRWDADNFITGTLDEIAIWNVALSGPAIASIYKHQSAKFAGTFQSRVIDNFSSSSWSSFQWKSPLPFSKELPDYSSGSVQSESISDYSSLYSNTLMTGIIGLWHLDEVAGTSTASSVIDRSGNNNNGTPSSMTFGVPGKLSTAASFNGTSSAITISQTNLPTGNSPFTCSVWIKTTQSTASGYPSLFSYGTPSTGAGIFFSLCNNSDGNCNPGGTLAGRAMIGPYGNSLGSNVAVNDGVWHHIVATYDGSVYTLYVDGVNSGSKAMTTNLAYSATPTIGYGGGLYASMQYFNGSMDEFAIWSRALASSEVNQLYRRGANRIQYQVRTCPDSSCSTNPSWLGPDNSNQTYFSELNNNLLPADGSDKTTSDGVQKTAPAMNFASFGPLAVPANRYFQYRAIMESDDAGTSCNYSGSPTWCSPELKSVTVGAP